MFYYFLAVSSLLMRILLSLQGIKMTDNSMILTYIAAISLLFAGLFTEISQKKK